MRKTLLLYSLSLIAFSCEAQEKKLCISIDDLPVVTYGVNDPGFHRELTEKLMATIERYDVPAIGYVNEGKLYKNGKLDSSRVGLLELWLKSGCDLGNHTYSHKNYDQTDFDEYTADILLGEKISKPLCLRYNKEFKYFRHPFLRAGNTKASYDSLNNFLAANGYTVAPVTIDDEDYLFAAAYQKAFNKKDTATVEKIGESYVSYMEEKLLYYERLSQELLGRNIAHTLLIHANRLNSDYLDDLAEMYKRYGYEFVSQEEVLKDEAYQTPVTRFGDWGISWIDRWALSMGKKGTFFEGDPQTPEFVNALVK